MPTPPPPLAAALQPAARARPFPPPAYAPSLDPSPDWPGVRNYLRSISAMPEYRHLSAEELRLRDYTTGGSALAPYAPTADPDTAPPAAGRGHPNFHALVAMPAFAHVSLEEVRLADYWVRDGGRRVRPPRAPFAPAAPQIRSAEQDRFQPAGDAEAKGKMFPCAWGAPAKAPPRIPRQESDTAATQKAPKDARRSNALRDRVKQVDRLGRSPSMPIQAPAHPRPVLASSPSLRGIEHSSSHARDAAAGTDPAAPFATAPAQPAEPVERGAPAAPRAVFQPSPLAKLGAGAAPAPRAGEEPSSVTTSPSLLSVASPGQRGAAQDVGRSRLYRQLQAMCRKAEEFDEALDDLEEEQKLKSLCRKADEFNRALDRLAVNHALPKFRDKEEDGDGSSAAANGVLRAPHNTPMPGMVPDDGGPVAIAAAMAAPQGAVSRDVEAEECGLDSVASPSVAPPGPALDIAASSTANVENRTIAKPVLEKDGSDTIASRATAPPAVASPAEGTKLVKSPSQPLQFVPAFSTAIVPSLPVASAPNPKVEKIDQVRSAASDVNILEKSPSSVFKPLSPQLSAPSAEDCKSPDTSLSKDVEGSAVKEVKAQTAPIAAPAADNTLSPASATSYRYFLGFGIDGATVDHDGNTTPSRAFSDRKSSRANRTPKSGKKTKAAVAAAPKPVGVRSVLSAAAEGPSPGATQKVSPSKPPSGFTSPASLKSSKISRSHSVTISVSSENTVKRHHAEPVIDVPAFPSVFPADLSDSKGQSAAEVLEGIGEKSSGVAFRMGGSPARASPRRSSGNSSRRLSTGNPFGVPGVAKEGIFDGISVSNHFAQGADRQPEDESNLVETIELQSNESSAPDRVHKAASEANAGPEKATEFLEAYPLAAPLLPASPEVHSLSVVDFPELSEYAALSLPPVVTLPELDASDDLASETESPVKRNVKDSEIEPAVFQSSVEDTTVRDLPSPTPSPVVTPNVAEELSKAEDVTLSTPVDAKRDEGGSNVGEPVGTSSDSVDSVSEETSKLVPSRSVKLLAAAFEKGLVQSKESAGAVEKIGTERIAEVEPAAEDQDSEGEEGYKIVSLKQFGLPAAFANAAVSSTAVRSGAKPEDSGLQKEVAGGDDLANPNADAHLPTKELEAAVEEAEEAVEGEEGVLRNGNVDVSKSFEGTEAKNVGKEVDHFGSVCRKSVAVGGDSVGAEEEPFFIVLSRDASDNGSSLDVPSGPSFTIENASSETIVPGDARREYSRPLSGFASALNAVKEEQEAKEAAAETEAEDTLSRLHVSDSEDEGVSNEAGFDGAGSDYSPSSVESKRKSLQERVDAEELSQKMCRSKSAVIGRRPAAIGEPKRNLNRNVSTGDGTPNAPLPSRNVSDGIASLVQMFSGMSLPGAIVHENSTSESMGERSKSSTIWRNKTPASEVSSPGKGANADTQKDGEVEEEDENVGTETIEEIVTEEVEIIDEFENEDAVLSRSDSTTAKSGVKSWLAPVSEELTDTQSSVSEQAAAAFSEEAAIAEEQKIASETGKVFARGVAPISFGTAEKSFSKRNVTLAQAPETSDSTAGTPDKTLISPGNAATSPETANGTPKGSGKPALVISPGRPAQSPRFASVMRAGPAPGPPTPNALVSRLSAGAADVTCVPATGNGLVSVLSAGAVDATCVPSTPPKAPRPAIANSDITPGREPRTHDSQSESSTDGKATPQLPDASSMTTLPTPIAGRQTSLTRRHSVPPRRNVDVPDMCPADSLLAAHSVTFSEDASEAGDEVSVSPPHSGRGPKAQGAARGARNHTMFGALAGITGAPKQKKAERLAPRASTDVGTGRKSMSAAVSPTTAAVQKLIVQETTLRAQTQQGSEERAVGRAGFLDGVKRLFSRVGRRKDRGPNGPAPRRMSLARGEKERTSIGERHSVARRTKSEYRSPPKARGRERR